MKQLISAVLLIGAMMAANTYGQKVGHVNFQALIQELPDYEVALETYDAYRKSLEPVMATYQSELSRLYKEVEAIDPVKNKAQYEIKIAQIKDMEERAQTAQQSMQDSLANKETELMQPLQAKVTQAVEAIAKEKGYSHVINNAPGLLIYAKESDNLDDAVRAKLGIKKPVESTPAPGTGTPKAGNH